MKQEEQSLSFVHHAELEMPAIKWSTIMGNLNDNIRNPLMGLQRYTYGHKVL